MTREQAKQIALIGMLHELRDKGAKVDDIYVASPMPGKNSWTYLEAIESIIKDEPMENTSDNPIDDIILYEKYTEEHPDFKGFLDRTEYESVKNGTCDTQKLIEALRKEINTNDLLNFVK